MTGFSQRRVGSWVFEAYGQVFPLPPDLTERVRQTRPNRADRRRAARQTTSTVDSTLTTDNAALTVVRT
jgi:hypothetical protein